MADILQEGTGLESFLRQPVQGRLEVTKLLPRGLHTQCYVGNSTKMRSAFFTLVRMCVQRGFSRHPYSEDRWAVRSGVTRFLRFHF